MKDHTRRRNIEQMKKDEDGDTLMLKQINGEVGYGAELNADADAHGWTIPKVNVVPFVINDRLIKTLAHVPNF